MIDFEALSHSLVSHTFLSFKTIDMGGMRK